MSKGEFDPNNVPAVQMKFATYIPNSWSKYRPSNGFKQHKSLTDAHRAVQWRRFSQTAIIYEWIDEKWVELERFKNG